MIWPSLFDSFGAMGEIVDTIDTIHSQSGKCATGVENKATGDSKPNLYDNPEH